LYNFPIIIGKLYKEIITQMQPKGFGKNYFSLAAIQAHVSQQKVVAMCASTSTLSGKPLTIKIASPPSA
ncbi:MAG: hypothetical protein PF437_02180, partial [Sulfurimonas sp.]|nr:hypothetical protein [Sulfurimonas sp.]